MKPTKQESRSIFTAQRTFNSQSDHDNLQQSIDSTDTLRRGSDLSGDTALAERPRVEGIHPETCEVEPSAVQSGAVRLDEAFVNKAPILLPASVTIEQEGTAGLREPATPDHNSLSRKRHAPTSEASIPRSEPVSKRARSVLKPRHTLDPTSFPKGLQLENRQDITSPLFFSHTPRQRPALISGFSSSEAAAAMLNKARDEGGGVTTVKLARGSISNASPPRSTGTPGSWASLTRQGSTPRSPDSAPTDASALQVLGGIGITDLLEQDERPTFIIDLANNANYNPGQLQLMFANASLRSYDILLDMVVGKAADLDSPGRAIHNTYPEFKAWILSFVKNFESLDVCLPSFLFGGVSWSCSTLKKRLRVISGSSNTRPAKLSSGSTSATHASSIVAIPEIPAAVNAKGRPGSPLAQMNQVPDDYFGDAFSRADSKLSTTIASGMVVDSPQNLSAGITDIPTPLPMSITPMSALSHTLQPIPSFDWTRLPVSASMPRHIQFARSIDWASTPLGPIESWSFDLRAMCNMIMGSPHPAAMYWGDEYIAIYNEAYVLLAGQKHPQLMGQSYKTAWKEIWPDIEEVFTSAKESGQATMKDDDCLFIMRNGFLEESFFSWSIVPLVGEDGTVAGLYNPAFEKTRRKIAERRMLTLREVGERSATAREVGQFWNQVLKGLEYNEFDVPFVYMYSVSDDVDSDMSSMHSGSLAPSPQCVLEGTLGVPEGHASLVSPLDLRNSEQSWAPFLRQAMRTDKPILLSADDNDGSLSKLIKGLQFRGFGDVCRSAVVCPIHPTTGESILGFLVMGVNPRRPYDDDYSLFIQLLSRQLATSMASVVLFEEEIRRGQRAARLAAQDRIELSKQLDLRTQEAVESETRFTRMAEFAPVGMFIANQNGRIIFSNETWWIITRHPRELNSADTWMDCVMDEDRSAVEESWHQVVVDKVQITHEFRVKAPWQDGNGSKGETWLLMNAYPEKGPDGELKSIFGCLTDISQQKFAEGFQKRRMEEAVELKRQQENFIDITSHEMRNPLSAILQCADEITTTLSEYKTGASDDAKLMNAIESSIDASCTIALCASHQKRIVDDVLTLSKLDSALLLVTPVDVQPVAVVQRALKMFEGELDTNDISLQFQVEPSYIDLQVDWIKADPSRLLQVLINLTTNAIKFTHTQEKRTIIVSIGASKERPSNISNTTQVSTSTAETNRVAYFPSRAKRKDALTGEDWGDGEEIFIHFAVQDTGRGLDNDEKNLLFRRFSQASPRTHVQYGGSGLGLFISRELTELQGGEIGVASERGVGSTFAFYIKGRRAATPNGAIQSLPKLMRRDSAGKATLTTSIKTLAGKSSHKMAQPNNHERPELNNRSSSLEKGALKVLIVEDNLVNQRVLQKQLNNLGCVTHVANHGGEALEMLKKSRFWSGQETIGIELSVVLMDLEMPVMDGLTCARRIRELEADSTITKHVPIIAVTANARLEQIETAIQAGMDDVVSKPFRIPELIPKIEELMEKFKEEGKASGNDDL